MENNDKNTNISQSCQNAVISCIHFLFKVVNWNHFRIRHSNGKRYYTKIVKIKGFRTAVVDNICGGRTTNRFYWTIGKYSL
jgi:hypothetical protein